MGWRTITLAALLVAVAASTATAGTVTLDQQQLKQQLKYAVNKSSTGGRQVHQTFTVGLAGTLEKVDLNMVFDTSLPKNDGSVVVEIRSTSGGVPSFTNVLASTSTATSNLNQVFDPLFPSHLKWVTFDFSAAAIAVSVGDVLAVSVRAVADADGVAGFIVGSTSTSVDKYAGGNRFHVSGAKMISSAKNDLVFRTYVNVPATVVPLPASAWIGFGLLGALGAVRRVRRRRNQRS